MGDLNKVYAVIKAGGHQYKVSEGDSISIDYQEGKEKGDKITFDNVLLIGGDKTVTGSPLVKGASVVAEVEEQTANDKVIVFKFKRRKNYKRTRGHKQKITVVKIGKISNG